MKMQQENKKWYAEQLYEKWVIVTHNSNEILNSEDVGEEQAESNAKLCASAPEMKELLDDMALWLGAYRESTWLVSKNHPVIGLLDRYNKLIEK